MLGNNSNMKKLMSFPLIIFIIIDCAELFVYASEFWPFIPVAVNVVSSPESDPKSFWIAEAFFFFLPPNFLGFHSRCKNQQCASPCPFFLQWVHEGLSFFTMFSFLSFHFSFFFSFLLLTEYLDDPPKLWVYILTSSF